MDLEFDTVIGKQGISMTHSCAVLTKVGAWSDSEQKAFVQDGISSEGTPRSQFIFSGAVTA